MTIATPVRPSISAGLLAAFDKEFGDNSAYAMPTDFIDTGFAPLNYILSGDYSRGLAFGRLYEVFGESSTGKTALATEWMARAQKMGGCAGFIDWERSFNQDLAVAGYNLCTDRPYWLYKKPMTWEEGNTAATNYCKFIRENKIIAANAPILIVLDSIAAAVPRSMAEKEFDEYSMNDTTALARVSSTTLRSIAMRAEMYNATFVYLNQVRLKPGVVYGDPTTTPGGKSMEFFATGRLSLSRKKVMQVVDGGKEFVGQDVGIKCVKSKMTMPNKSTSLRMSFDDNGMAYFDMELSLVEALVAEDKIKTPRNGYVEFDGKQYSKKAFADHIRLVGLTDQLVKLFSA